MNQENDIRALKPEMFSYRLPGALSPLSPQTTPGQHETQTMPRNFKFSHLPASVLKQEPNCMPALPTSNLFQRKEHVSAHSCETKSVQPPLPETFKVVTLHLPTDHGEALIKNKTCQCPCSHKCSDRSTVPLFQADRSSLPSSNKIVPELKREPSSQNHETNISPITTTGTQNCMIYRAPSSGYKTELTFRPVKKRVTFKKIVPGKAKPNYLPKEMPSLTDLPGNCTTLAPYRKIMIHSADAQSRSWTNASIQSSVSADQGSSSYRSSVDQFIDSGKSEPSTYSNPSGQDSETSTSSSFDFEKAVDGPSYWWESTGLQGSMPNSLEFNLEKATDGLSSTYQTFDPENTADESSSWPESCLLPNNSCQEKPSSRFSFLGELIDRGDATLGNFESGIWNSSETNTNSFDQFIEGTTVASHASCDNRYEISDSTDQWLFDVSRGLPFSEKSNSIEDFSDLIDFSPHFEQYAHTSCKDSSTTEGFLESSLFDWIQTPTVSMDAFSSPGAYNFEKYFQECVPNICFWDITSSDGETKVSYLPNTNVAHIRGEGIDTETSEHKQACVSSNDGSCSDLMSNQIHHEKTPHVFLPDGHVVIDGGTDTPQIFLSSSSVNKPYFTYEYNSDGTRSYFDWQGFANSPCGMEFELPVLLDLDSQDLKQQDWKQGDFRNVVQEDTHLMKQDVNRNEFSHQNRTPDPSDSALASFLAETVHCPPCPQETDWRGNDCVRISRDFTPTQSILSEVCRNTVCRTEEENRRNLINFAQYETPTDPQAEDMETAELDVFKDTRTLLNINHSADSTRPDLPSITDDSFQDDLLSQFDLDYLWQS